MPNMDYNILIHKYLTGEISPEDEKRLEAWLAASPENQQIFDELKQIWESADDEEEEMTDHTFQEEMEKLESAVQDSVNKDNLIRRYQRTSRIRNLVFVAVVVVASAFAATLYFKEARVNSLSFSNTENNLLVLPDSSKVLLNRNSSLTFNSADNKREAILHGEAMFEVKEETRPFTVSTGGVSVRVVGTSFIVKSYADSAVQVTVISGKVKVQFNNQETTLVPGEKSLTTHSGTLTKSVNDDPNFNSWYTRKLEFKNTELETVLKLVEELYQVNFRVNEKRILGCRFTGKFDNTRLEDVLKTLAFSLDIEFTSQLGNYYQVSGSGCVP
jgi:ferric-dicitrate binding protein FerR (iron transport regulator)